MTASSARVAAVVRELRALARDRAVEAAAPAAPPADPVEALRRRLAGQPAREHVVLDFLADDLREARQALAGVEAYLGRVEAALGDAAASQEQLLALAQGGGPAGQLDYLAEVLEGLRRRVAQVAARM